MCRELFGKIEYDCAAVCKEQLRSMQALQSKDIFLHGTQALLTFDLK